MCMITGWCDAPDSRITSNADMQEAQPETDVIRRNGGPQLERHQGFSPAGIMVIMGPDREAQILHYEMVQVILRRVQKN